MGQKCRVSHARRTARARARARAKARATVSDSHSPIHSARTSDPRLQIAAVLVAATGAARNPANIRNPRPYIEGSANSILREHGATWQQLIDHRPSITAEDLAYAVTAPYAPGGPELRSHVRTLVDGTQQRFLPGTGWVRYHQTRDTDTSASSVHELAAMRRARTTLAPQTPEPR